MKLKNNNKNNFNNKLSKHFKILKNDYALLKNYKFILINKNMKITIYIILLNE
jgi:hypothetical protein